MRLALTLAAALMGSTAAFADDIVIRADIAAATIYQSGADITRRATVTIPAGEHRLLIALPDAAQADLIEVAGPDGVILGAVQRLSGFPIAEGALDDPEQAAARAVVDAAEAALQQAQDDLTGADATIRGIEAQQAYLTALSRGGPDGAAMPTDPALLPQTLAALGVEVARLQNELLAAQVARRDLIDATTDRAQALADATDALARLAPFGPTIDGVEVSLRADTPVEGVLTLDYLTPSTSWEPRYALRLDSGTGALAMERAIAVTTRGGARWQGVEMTFSTAQPGRQRQPSDLYPDPARIMEPQPPAVSQIEPATSEARIADAVPAEMFETSFADLQIQGLSVSYVYATPVSLDANGTAVLPFDTLTLDTTTEIRAAPRYDQTAFLVAIARNDSGAPILPGAARFYRDGALVGEDYLPLIATGAEVDLAFGPIDHLRLTWIDRSMAEGNRGLFTTSTTQTRNLAFGVENTGTTTETVRLIYATPFAEQDSLSLDLTLSPVPSAVDTDDRRGVHAWDLTVAPGQTALIEMAVVMSWPEGQVLTWQP